MTVSSATRNMYPLVTIMIHTLQSTNIIIYMYMQLVGYYIDLQADQIVRLTLSQQIVLTCSMSSVSTQFINLPAAL